ncbi:MAG: NAD(P)-dependent oxidoreductase [Acidobacteriota bacterium]
MTATRALVTGGAGFVGRRLVEALVVRGWQVWAVDDFSTGRPADLAAIGDGTACHVVEADVAAAPSVAAAVAAAQPSVVFHLAAIHFIPQCERDPLRTLQTNVIGTQAVLNAVQSQPGCRMVFASTGDVYTPSIEPHHEGSALGPPSLYGLSKATGERLVERAGDQGVDYRIARLFNIFGPGDRVPHVLPDIVNRLSRGGVLALGRLDAVRDYVYVDDVVQALIALSGHDGPDRIFNIGTGEGRSVQDLVAGVEAACGFPLSIRTDPAKVRPVERPVLVSDSSLARAALGWVPRMAFQDGITRVVAAALANTP